MTISLPVLGPDQVAIGNDAGWALGLCTESATGKITEVKHLSRESFYGDIEATLQSSLGAGIYKFTIEGLSDDEHAALSLTNPKRPTVARLYLYWRDTNATVAGYLAGLGGLTDLLSGGGLVGAATGALASAGAANPLASCLVAELSIDSVIRRVGSRRYETVIEATERVHKRLTQKLTGALEAEDREEAAEKIAERAGIEIEVDPPSAKAGGAGSKYTHAAGASYAEVLAEIARDYEQASGKYGIGQLLIRDGTLHLGQREVPLESEDLTLDLARGLIETQLLRDHHSDPNHDPASGTPPPTRQEYQLTCKGRADIKPGCVVSFEAPTSDSEETPLSSAIAGAFAGGGLIASLSGAGNPKTRAYVSSVRHRLGRTSSFSTIVTCMQLHDETDEGWDEHSPGPSRPSSTGGAARTGTSDPAGDAAGAVARRAQSTIARVQTTEVGEVRALQTADSGDAPAQSETVWRGLAPPDGMGRQAARLPIRRRQPEPLTAVPYLSPFAWGKCGLLLPRYPGTRVLMAHRNGEASDPVELGALWESGKGPQNGQVGDWWLTLPTEVEDPQQIADTETPADYAGKVSNDLIDASGNRMIEVAGMTIRVGQEALKSAGTRPAGADEEEALRIEHGDGLSRIVLKKGGEVEIHAKKITLSTEGVTATIDSSKLDVS